jgi:hypothetical protein
MPVEGSVLLFLWDIGVGIVRVWVMMGGVCALGGSGTVIVVTLGGGVAVNTLGISIVFVGNLGGVVVIGLVGGTVIRLNISANLVMADIV